MTIEELAQRSAMTVRNVREHQTRGLLPAPRLEGRKGFYDQRHLARLRLISQLQAEGLNLQAIAWLVERAPAEATEEVARFERALFAPWQVEPTIVLERSELNERFGRDDRVLQRAITAGILEPLDGDRYRVTAPSLLQAGEELVALGIPLDAALDVVERLRAHADAVASDFTALFLDEIWKPFAADGRPAERWGEVRQALERLRPLASQALLSVFQQAMTAATTAEIARMAGDRDQGSRSA